MNQFRRRSIRLRDYDYGAHGAYFVTLCTQLRYLHFDDITIKQIAEDCWKAIPDHFPNTELDEWIVMPNHLHGIILITETSTNTDNRRGVQLNAHPTSRQAPASPYRGTLAVIVRTYKAAVTSACRKQGKIDFAWQRNYYEHIIRNEGDLNRIREYIVLNPMRWEEDTENPNRA
jgi:putative transposase